MSLSKEQKVSLPQTIGYDIQQARRLDNHKTLDVAQNFEVGYRSPNLNHTPTQSRIPMCIADWSYMTKIKIGMLIHYWIGSCDTIVQTILRTCPSFKNAVCDNAVYIMGVSIKRRHVTGPLHYV